MASEEANSQTSDCLGPSTKKKRAKPWSTEEEVILVQFVTDNEHLLFGDIKAHDIKGITRKRAELWGEAAEKINIQNINRREPEEVKKKYFNLKQRAKSKYDTHRRESRKTGGGPAPPPLSNGEEAILQAMDGRPVLSGLSFGVDTDEPANTQEIVIKESTSSTDLSVVAGSSKEPEIPHKKQEQEPACSTKSLISSNPRKRKISSQAEETLKNTQLDNERIMIEKEKLKLEIEKLKSEINKNKTQEETMVSIKKLAETMTSYYEQKIHDSLVTNMSNSFFNN